MYLNNLNTFDLGWNTWTGTGEILFYMVLTIRFTSFKKIATVIYIPSVYTDSLLQSGRVGVFGSM